MYQHGVEELFAMFPGSDAGPDKSVFFAAMIGAGLLGKALGQTEWIQQLQSAVLTAADDRSPTAAG